MIYWRLFYKIKVIKKYKKEEISPHWIWLSRCVTCPVLNCMFENSLFFCDSACISFSVPNQNSNLFLPNSITWIPYKTKLLVVSKQKKKENSPRIYMSQCFPLLQVYSVVAWNWFGQRRGQANRSVNGFELSWGIEAIVLVLAILEGVRDKEWRFMLWIRIGNNGAADFFGSRLRFLSLVNSGVWFRIKGLC